jgi:para-nitrobenzyl esterase
VSFITGGDPGWAPYDTVRRTTGLLTDTVSAVDDPAGGERARWDGIR